MGPFDSFKKNQSKKIVRQYDQTANAILQQQSFNHPSLVNVISFDLSKTITNPFKVAFPFKQVIVTNWTAENQLYLFPKIKIKFGGDDNNQPWLSLFENTNLTFDKIINEAYLTWDVQASSTIELTFLNDMKMEVTRNEFDDRYPITGHRLRNMIHSITHDSIKIMNSDLNRVCCTIYNEGPDTVFLGHPDYLTVNTGIPLRMGDTIKFTNTSNLHGICNYGLSAIIRIMEEFKDNS